MSITQLSVNRPTLIVVIFATLIFLGIFSYNNLNYELMPNFTSPAVIITIPYPGASPSEVENSVTKKVEDVVTTIEDIEDIHSYSSEGLAVIMVEFNLSVDIDFVLQETERKINSIRNDLPESMDEPTLSKISLSDLPIMKIGATASMGDAEFYDLLEHRIKPELSHIDGVGEANLIGGSEREIRVSLDAGKLETYNLSAMQVLQAIESSNQDFPTGNIKEETTQTVIRLSAKFQSTDEIKNVIITTANGSPVKVEDVAEVFDTEKEPVTIARVNGVNSVGINVKKQAGANTVKVSHLVTDELKQMEEMYKQYDLKFDIPMNNSEFTEKAASSVMDDLTLAVILVALVMLVFLHSLRNAFIVMVAVPLSLISSFVGMYLLGYTLNMMTLLAMSLVIGILVDDAIVVVENIYRHLEMGKDKKTATIDGRTEISFTAIAITLVDVVVFLPIALSRSMVSPIIEPYAMVIVITTLLSLFVAFTAVPALTSRLGKHQKINKKSIFGKFTLLFEKLVDELGSVIHSILIWAFRHKILTFVIVIVLFFGSIALIPAGFVGSEFASMGDASEFMIQIELPKDATLRETNQKVLDIEKIIYSKPEVTTVFTTVGSSTSGFKGTSTETNKAEINVKLIDKEYRNISSQSYANNIQNELITKIPGVKINTGIVNQFMGGTDDAPIQVIVESEVPDSLEKYGRIVTDLIKKTAGAKDIKSSLEDSGPELEVAIDKEKMADLGLSLSQIGSVMQTAFSGNTDAKFRDGAYEYDINVIYDQFDRQNSNDVANLTFLNTTGQQIKLSQFADISYGTGSSQIERYNRTSAVSIEGQVFGRSSGDVGDDIKTQVAELTKAGKIPPEVSVSYEGDMKMQDDAFGSLGLAMMIAIFLVYMVMVALYESYLYPFVVLFSIPMAIIGAVFALALAKSTISLFSLLGMIMLIGLVAKNAILVVDFTNHLRKEGYSVVRALLTSVKLRLRPVLMTTVAMIIGLMPIALASGPASEWKNGLAWVLIGGLTSSMMLTLVIVPLVYLIFDSLKVKVITFLAARKKHSGEEVEFNSAQNY